MPLHSERVCALQQELGLSYLNEYIMHWPIAGNEGDAVKPPIEVFHCVKGALIPAPCHAVLSAAYTATVCAVRRVWLLRVLRQQWSW